MKQKAKSKKLTKVEWFGLISGIIGLVTNAYTLYTAFIQSQINKSNLPPNSEAMPAAKWAMIFFGIVYTTFVLSFLARKLLSVRHKRRTRLLPKAKSDRIEAGSYALTIMVGAPPIMLYAILGLIASDDVPASMKSPGYHAFLGFVIGLLASLIICSLLSLMAGLLYSAFDPDYRLDDDEKESDGLRSKIRVESNR